MQSFYMYFFTSFILALLVTLLIIRKRGNKQEVERIISECADFLDEMLAPFDREQFINAMKRRGNEVEPWMFGDAELKRLAWQKNRMESIRLNMKELRLRLGHKADSEPWKTRLETFQAKIDTINNS